MFCVEKLLFLGLNGFSACSIVSSVSIVNAGIVKVNGSPSPDILLMGLALLGLILDSLLLEDLGDLGDVEGLGVTLVLTERLLLPSTIRYLVGFCFNFLLYLKHKMRSIIVRTDFKMQYSLSN